MFKLPVVTYSIPSVCYCFLISVQKSQHIQYKIYKRVIIRREDREKANSRNVKLFDIMNYFHRHLENR
jgi:poly(A) polymerase Pap1